MTHDEQLKKLTEQLRSMAQELKNTKYEFGFVLKALEEELVANDVITVEGLQMRIMHLEAIGWTP